MIQAAFAQSVPLPPSSFVKDHADMAAYALWFLLFIVVVQALGWFSWVRSMAKESSAAMRALDKTFEEFRAENAEAHAAIIQGRVAIQREVAALSASQRLFLRRLDHLEYRLDAIQTHQPVPPPTEPDPETEAEP